MLLNIRIPQLTGAFWTPLCTQRKTDHTRRNRGFPLAEGWA